MIKPFAFVLMPFDDLFSDIYQLGIRAAANDVGIVAERVDEQVFSETILERIYRQIEAADFIIADMTGKNSNVFYEVGYAHAKGKTCILLTQTTDDIPFDLKHHPHLIYEGSIQKLRKELSRTLTVLKVKLEVEKTKTIQISLGSVTGLLSTSEWRADGEVDITIDISNKTDRRSPEIEAMYLYTGDGWSFKQNDQECLSTKPEIEGYSLQHFIKSPVNRLAPNVWAPLKLKGQKTLWRSYSGDELQDSYRLIGRVVLEISTSEGIFRENLNLDIVVNEIPF